MHMVYLKYTQEMLQEAVDNSLSVAGVMRYLGLVQNGGNATHMRNRINKFGIDTSHFTGQRHSVGLPALNRKTAEKILVILPAGSPRPKVRQLRRAMQEMGMEMKCRCGLTDEWHAGRLVLEVDHINGNWLDNRLENLRFLCPNCHSQEPTSSSWKNKPV